jgi:hypothetical protein
MEGGCELLEKGPLALWEAMETTEKDETFTGTYRLGLSEVSVFCWSSGKRRSLALLVLSDPKAIGRRKAR